MATVTVLGNGLAIPGSVRAVMTTETSGKVHVAQVVRISAPQNLQIWEHVTAINPKNGPARLLDVFRTVYVEVGIVLLIKINERRWQSRGCFCTCRVVYLQQLHTLLLDVR